MIEYIYGPSGTGKTLYALQKAYISKKSTAYIPLEMRIGDAVKFTEEWFPDHKFSIHDARHITIDNLYDYMKLLAESVDIIVIDSLGMLLSHTGYPISPELNKLVSRLQRSKWSRGIDVYIIEHSYSNILATTSDSAYSQANAYTTLSKCHKDDELISNSDFHVYRAEKKGFVFSVGQVRFTVDERYKITEWFDKDVDDAMENNHGWV